MKSIYRHNLRLSLILIVITFYFLANIQRVAIPGAIFDTLQGDLGANASKITMLGAVFCYIYALTQLIVGVLVDKIGGFKVALIGIIAFVTGAILFPQGDNFFFLYLSRALLGFGSATFYLSSIREVKKFAKDKNFSIAVSFILFAGYSGGFFANAPLVALVNLTNWKNVFLNFGYFSLFIGVLYCVLLLIFKPVHCEKKAKLTAKPFIEVLKKPQNRYLYIFGGINYGLYYVLQSVLGKKILQDFCLMSENASAIILSIMAVVSACAGVLTSIISKKIGNKRAIIYRTMAFYSIISIFIICILLYFNIKTEFIAILFLITAYTGSISPLLIYNFHLINEFEISATAVAIQSFNFFMIVGVLGAISGYIMHLYTPIKTQSALIYPNSAYLSVFVMFFVLSLISLIHSFKIED